MKVRVSYNTELNDVPELIDNILARCREKVSKISKDLKIEYSNHERTLSNMSSIRESLELIDEQIQDCVNLYSGWHTAVTPSLQNEYDDVPATKEMAIQPEDQADEPI